MLFGWRAAFHNHLVAMIFHRMCPMARASNGFDKMAALGYVASAKFGRKIAP